MGWILLFQLGSILHHYINTQCNDRLSGNAMALSHTVTRSTHRRNGGYSGPGYITTFSTVWSGFNTQLP